MNTADLVRLNKFLADCGIASRRSADELITDGRVKLNGQVVRELGVKIDPQKDVVVVAGKQVNVRTSYTYILFNKPVGVTSTTADSHAEKTVVDMVRVQERVYPVGRLDKESRGLVLLTNDGELTFRLTHPKYHVPKTYLVTVVGTVSDMKIAKIRHGVDLEDGRTARAEVRILSQSRETTLEIVLFEGKKREIRRMCAALHLHVVDLQRVAFGSLLLDSLREGMWRKLTEKEVGALYVSVGLTKL